MFWNIIESCYTNHVPSWSSPAVHQNSRWTSWYMTWVKECTFFEKTYIGPMPASNVPGTADSLIIAEKHGALPVVSLLLMWQVWEKSFVIEGINHQRWIWGPPIYRVVLELLEFHHLEILNLGESPCYWTKPQSYGKMNLAEGNLWAQLANGQATQRECVGSVSAFLFWHNKSYKNVLCKVSFVFIYIP